MSAPPGWRRCWQRGRQNERYLKCFGYYHRFRTNRSYLPSAGGRMKRLQKMTQCRNSSELSVFDFREVARRKCISVSSRLKTERPSRRTFVGVNSEGVQPPNFMSPRRAFGVIALALNWLRWAATFPYPRSFPYPRTARGTHQGTTDGKPERWICKLCRFSGGFWGSSERSAAGWRGDGGIRTLDTP